MRKLLVAVCVLACGSSTLAQENERRGTVRGGLAGAAIGAIIGDNNDEAGAGAAIGGVVGAMAGSLLGQSADEEQQRRQYYRQQQLARQQQQQFEAIQHAVSTADVTAMVRGGLPDTVIINQVRQRGVQRRLEVADIIHLHQSGVSEPVISAMQTAQIGETVRQYAPPAPAPQQVIVERHYEVAPVYVVPRPRPRPGVHFHYSTGRHYRW